ncbi:MAG: dihydrodipicolinate reductase [Armatimonadota bacterium]
MIRTLHVGLGTIGREIIRACMSRNVSVPSGAVDINPNLLNSSLSDLVTGAPEGAPVYGSISDAVAGGEYDVAVLCTASHIPDVRDDLEALINAGIDVVSTTEELSYPQLQHPEVSAELNAAARDAGVSIVGTGVNPGFVLDLLPAIMTRPCVEIASISARRIVNTQRRRKQLQLKVGAGMSPQKFRALAEEGQIGHVGLLESLALVAEAVGSPVDLDAVEHSLEPVIATEDIASDEVTVAAGEVCGAEESVRLSPTPETSIELFLRMRLGEPEEYDEVRIEGVPPIVMRIEGGVHGDVATAGCTANIIPATLNARAGLLTVLDLPIV